MNTQKFFKYQFTSRDEKENFFLNSTNKDAFNLSNLNNFDQNIFLFGPRKSGKTYLVNIWKEKNNALIYRSNFDQVIRSKNNIAIDDVFVSTSEEELFHIINHCKLFNLKMYLSSSINLPDYTFRLKDLYSRLRSFYYSTIKLPDDEMCIMFMTKLFSEKQIIVKNKEIFEFIFNRIDRSYLDIYLFVEKIDKLSLEKKRQLTIPLIKEII